LSTLLLLIATGLTAALALLAAGHATALPKIRRLHAAYVHAWHLAHVDELTGLSNRRHGLNVLQQRLDAHEPTLVMLLDLDRFKTINDTYGHAAGDQLLQQCAARLETAANAAGGSAARLGGDEFLIVVPTGSGSYTATVADILIRLEQPLTLQPAPDTTVKLTPRASAGLALTGPRAWTITALLHRADLALYQTKREEGWYRLHHGTTTPAAAERSRLRHRDMHRTGRHAQEEQP
jgi:diguanylate cyclase (GGDEF)-like protein